MHGERGSRWPLNLDNPSKRTLQKRRKKWIDALRSGKYKQCIRALSFDGGFCCLGVACEVALDSGVPLKKIADNHITLYDNQRTILPGQVVRFYGLRDYNGGYAPNEHGVKQKCLSQDNDGGAPFEKIADTIEKHRKEIFI